MSTVEEIRTRLVERRFDWALLDREAGRASPHVLDLLRETCLIESYMPVYTSRLVDLFWGDLPALEVLTIEAFEAYTHYLTLRRYLDAVGGHAIDDGEIRSLWEGRIDERFTDPIRELVNLMATEQFAANFFTDLLGLVEEPLLRSILPVFAREEVVHSQLAYDLLVTRVEADPAVVDRIIDNALEMRHLGSYILPSVTPAGPDNLGTLLEFSRKIETLTGRPLTALMLEHLEIKAH
ncbi:MAG TPA: hypothetical protein VFB34_06660 [Chloroflexota bacterium]|nr:hypothetical protein [Chloroflexota bacterium]